MFGVVRHVVEAVFNFVQGVVVGLVALMLLPHLIKGAVPVILVGMYSIFTS